jgi:TldD protein
MIEELKREIEKSDATFASGMYEIVLRKAITYSKMEVERVQSTTVNGGRIFALNKGGFAASSFTSPDKMGESARKAEKAAARMKSYGKEHDLAVVKPVKDRVTPSPNIDPRSVPFEEKRKLIEDYTSKILSAPGIFTTTVTYEELFRKKYFVSSEGSEIEQEVLLCMLFGRIIAKEGDTVESVGFSLGFDSDYEKLVDRQDVVERKAKVAVDLVRARPVKGGAYTVVCNSDLGAVFIHEAFGHLSESDDIFYNPSLSEAMAEGKVLGKPILNIVDQGNLPSAPGSYAYDDEGVPTQKTYLIKEGVLTGRLYSRVTGFQMGREATGNCRAVDYRFMPIVRMTNIYVEPGETSFDELIGSIDDGLYLCEGKGGQTMGDIFTFGAQYGYEVKNGKIGSMVKGINISGNVFETLDNIDMIGDDLVMIEGGGCGKTRIGMYDMQMLDKSGLGSPHVRIKNVLIGGS